MQTYELRSLSRGRNVADLLRDVLSELGHPVPKISMAQETTARLMGHASWQALASQVSQAPAEGAEDRDLGYLAGEIPARRTHQAQVLRERHGLDELQAVQVIERIQPTGRIFHEEEAKHASRPFPQTQWRPEPGGLKGTEDQTLRQALNSTVAEFDRAARHLLRVIPTYKVTFVPRLTDWQSFLRSIAEEARYAEQRPDGDDERRVWAAAMTERSLAHAEILHAQAQAAVNATWKTVRELGTAPFLTPVRLFHMQLQRVLGKVTYGTIRDYRAPIERECWLWIDHECHGELGGHDLERSARKWIDIKVEMRRAFLDAGWKPEGSTWAVSYRIDGDGIVTRFATAPDAGCAVAWIAASLAFGRLVHDARDIRRIRIVRVESARGSHDIEAAVTEALSSSFWSQGKLSGWSLMTGKPRAKPAANWTETTCHGQPAISWVDLMGCPHRVTTLLPADCSDTPVVVSEEDVQGKHRNRATERFLDGVGSLSSLLT